MVYNAMKLFMEINPQLFDDCSQDYNELQANAPVREEDRLSKWAKVQQLADKSKHERTQSSTNGGTSEPKIDTDATQENQKRLDALKLHDDSNAPAKQQSVSYHDLLPLADSPSPFPKQVIY